jgi:hypothetical protein
MAWFIKQLQSETRGSTGREVADGLAASGLRHHHSLQGPKKSHDVCVKDLSVGEDSKRRRAEY